MRRRSSIAAHRKLPGHRASFSMGGGVNPYFRAMHTLSLFRCLAFLYPSESIYKEVYLSLLRCPSTLGPATPSGG